MYTPHTDSSQLFVGQFFRGIDPGIEIHGNRLISAGLKCPATFDMFRRLREQEQRSMLTTDLGLTILEARCIREADDTFTGLDM